MAAFLQAEHGTCLSHLVFRRRQFSQLSLATCEVISRVKEDVNGWEIGRGDEAVEPWRMRQRARPAGEVEAHLLRRLHSPSHRQLTPSYYSRLLFASFP